VKRSYSRAVAAEFLGTLLLLAAVVGSGIMAERLAAGNAAITLLANSIATGAALIVLISIFTPVSRAHFNPVITMAAVLGNSFKWKEGAGYVLAQTSGAVGGVAVVHLMFNLPVFALSHHQRSGGAQVLSEGVATFGLVLAVSACGRLRLSTAPYLIGAYIASAYWFTSSTSFANPAVTFARSLTDTFAGIRPSDIMGFWVGQLVGAAAALVFERWLFASREGVASPSAGSAASP